MAATASRWAICLAKQLSSPALLLGGLFLGACSTAPDPSGLGEFRRSLSTTEHGYRIVEAPPGTAPSPTVERFEVRPGDCARETLFNDCAEDRERSEVAQVPRDRIRVGTEAWYGWNLYLPEDFPNVFPTKTVLGQFHQTRSHPLFMFLHTEAGLVLDDQLDRTKRNLLIPENRLRGRWHQIVIFARWRKDAGGLFRVFVDDELKSEHRGATVTADEVYLKYGVYRAFVSRYRTAHDTDTVPAQVAYFASVASASAREGLFTARPR